MSKVRVDRLREVSVEEDFSCPLCHNVLHDPVMAPNCNHIFCKRCISHHLRVHSSCPVDKSPLTINYLSNVSTLYREQLNSLEIKCKYHENGCTRWIKYGNLLDHESICLFKKIDINVHKVKFEQMLRSRLIASTGITNKSTNSYMLKLFQILEEKERLVKQQEQLITAIIDESDHVTQIMQQFTAAGTTEMTDAIDIIDKLEEENKLLRQRVSLSQDKLAGVHRMPRSQTTFDTASLLTKCRNNFTSDRATSALEGKHFTDALDTLNCASSSSFDLSPVRGDKQECLTNEASASINLARSPSARFYHTSSAHRNRSSSSRISHSSYGNRNLLLSDKSPQSKMLTHRPSSASIVSPKKSLRRGSFCSTNFSSRITSATVEHLDVIRRLKPRLSESVYRSIQLVDLADFYDFDPYQLTWAAYVADRIKRFAVHLKQGNRVLLISGWNDLYIAVTLAIFLGPQGLLVTRSSVPVFASICTDIDRVNRHHRYLLEQGQLLLLPHDTPDFTVNGYSEAAPYDVIFISSSLYTQHIDSQRNSDTGIVFDPYDNKDITGQFITSPVNLSTPTSPSIHVNSHHTSNHSSSLSNRSTEGDLNTLFVHSK